HVSHALLETDFAAQGFDLLTHVFHNAGQAKRTDVRFADVEDFFRRPGLDELVQDLATVKLRVLDLAVEFAVGKGACAAFAELNVGLWVEHVFTPQAPSVFGPLTDFLATLE
nr:hypothetical protein [Tanacetum cinerariifolium]